MRSTSFRKINGPGTVGPRSAAARQRAASSVARELPRASLLSPSPGHPALVDRRQRAADGSPRRPGPPRCSAGPGCAGAAGPGSQPGALLRAPDTRLAADRVGGRPSRPRPRAAEQRLPARPCRPRRPRSRLQEPRVPPAATPGATDRLHRHRIGRFPGPGRAGARSALAAPVAHRRNAPVERP